MIWDANKKGIHTLTVEPNSTVVEISNHIKTKDTKRTMTRRSQGIKSNLLFQNI